MKAEDTVKKVDWGDYNTHNCHWKVDKMLAEQAEISFKIGVDEVVKWVEHHVTERVSDGFYVGITRSEWQAQLKNWGVE